VPGCGKQAQELHAEAQRMGLQRLKLVSPKAEELDCITGGRFRPVFPRTKGSHVSKCELIDQIRRINTSASPDFLAAFSEEDLRAYFYQLQELEHELAQRHEPEPMLVAQG
jgi:hypothetical protein